MSKPASPKSTKPRIANEKVTPASTKRPQKHHHHVYVVELSRDVWGEPKFRKNNPDYDIRKPCVYVGMTGLNPDERFDKHMAGIKSSRYVRKYGLHLMPQLYEVYNPMPYEAAREMEVELAIALRCKGFFTSYVGEDKVIAVRDQNGDVQVLLNSCRHRGNPVCRAEEGNTKAFVCTYHGWTFDLQGNLVNVPGHKEVYHGELKRSEWGLIRAAQVASYGGFVFATFDPDADSAHPDVE